MELSYLSKELQTELFDVIEQDECTPSLSQAQRLKTAAQEGKLDRNGIELVMSEEKPNQKEKFTIQSDRVERFFPKSYSEKQKEDLIVQLLESWYKKRQREPER